MRDFQQEYKDKVNELGGPDMIFVATPLSKEMVLELTKTHLPNMPITGPLLDLEMFKAITSGDITLEQISKVLNHLHTHTAVSLNMELEAFIRFQSDLRDVMIKYNETVKPVKEWIERQAKVEHAKNNPAGAKGK